MPVRLGHVFSTYHLLAGVVAGAPEVYQALTPFDNPNLSPLSAAVSPLTTGWEMSSRLPTEGGFNMMPIMSTMDPGQAFSLQFLGDGLALIGNITEGSGADVIVTVDGSVQSLDTYNFTYNTFEPFFNIAGLELGYHNLTMETGPAFNGSLEITTLISSTMLFRDQNIPVGEEEYYGATGNRLECLVNGTTLDPRLTTTGNVSAYIYNTSASAFPTMQLMGDSSVGLAVPSNSTYLLLNGLVGPRYGAYNITLDPPPPVNSSSGHAFSTNRTWLSPDVFLLTPLNPNLHYTVTVSTSTATAGEGVHLTNFQVFLYNNQSGPFGPVEGFETPNQAPGDVAGGSSAPVEVPTSSAVLESVTAGASAKESPVGSIAGGVVGGVLGAALLSTLLVFFIRKRRRPFKGDEDEDSMKSFAVDEEEQDIVRPYPHNELPSAGSSSSALAKRTAPMASSVPSAATSSSHGLSHKTSSRGASSSRPSPVERPSTLMALTKAGSFAPNRSAQPESRPMPLQTVVVHQESDSGSLPVHHEFVPPQYNPQWAMRHRDLGT